MYDVFFSYPHKDSEKVMPILEALQARGLKVWIDTNEIRDFAGITRSIVDGLARSRVLMAYYSLNYAHSRACQWELTAGFLADQRKGDPRKRVLVINPEEMAEHIHPVELRDELEGAHKIQEQVLEIMRRVLGAEHPYTSMSAWNLFNTLGEMGEIDEAMKIFENDLVWLLDMDPGSLGADQGQIREMIIRMSQGADRPE